MWEVEWRTTQLVFQQLPEASTEGRRWVGTRALVSRVLATMSCAGRGCWLRRLGGERVERKERWLVAGPVIHVRMRDLLNVKPP
jgi:hypothetical protein